MASINSGALYKKAKKEVEKAVKAYEKTEPSPYRGELEKKDLSISALQEDLYDLQVEWYGVSSYEFKNLVLIKKNTAKLIDLSIKMAESLQKALDALEKIPEGDEDD